MTGIRLEDFTSQYDARHFLRTPFNRDGKTCASNGHTLVLFPENPDYAELDEKHKLNISQLVAEIDAAEFIPLPANITLPEPIPCGVCKGTGKAREIDCDECEGAGEVCFSNDHHDYEVTCKSCEGEGVSIEVGVGTCDNCKGTGKRFDRREAVKIADIYIDPNYLSFIIHAPDLLICALPDKLLFKSNDISGAIMKCHP
jgi:hypothetical protein